MADAGPATRKKKRVLVSAGDPSGDLILARVIRALKESLGADNVEFAGLCGPASLAEGVRPVANAVDVAVVGIWEVLKKLPTIFGVLGRMGRELARADLLLCVDFPDFNLRLARLARKYSVPVDFIIAPQVWAWRSGRIPEIKRLLRKLYPALPFEEEIFREAGVDARYMGHPIRDLLPPKSRREAREELGPFKPNDFVVCVMPGSRRGEIDRHLPLMLRAWRERQLLQITRPRPLTVGDDWKAVLPLAPGWTKQSLLENLDETERGWLASWIATGEFRIVSDSRRALMASDFGWITSGTATLEAAYYQIPHILAYKLSGFSAFLIGQLSHYFTDPEASAGLPNILLEKKVIPELLQDSLTPRRLALETIELLDDPTRLAALKRDLRWIPRKLGEAGATERIGHDIAASLQGSSGGGGGAT